MYTLIHLAVLTLTVLVLARLLPGFRIRTPLTAIFVALVFSVLNFALGWLIRVMLFLPAILTLGLLFLVLPLIVNAILLWLTDKLMGSFEIETLGGLLLSAAVITVVNGFFHVALHAHRMGLYHNPGPIRWI